MLTYTALLVASLVVSAIVYFLYRVISDSSRSVYTSRQWPALSDDPGSRRRESLNSGSAADRSAAYGTEGRSTPRNFVSHVPAKPTESINWGWQGSGVQLQQPASQPGQGTGNSSHCSLFAANPAAARPDVRPLPYQGMLRREEMHKDTGRIYKVKRRKATAADTGEDLQKPWGW